MQLNILTVPCPICHSRKVTIDDQDTKPWGMFDLQLLCRHCDATFTAKYTFYEVSDVRYGNPIGPVYLTDDPQQALGAWESEDAQWIRTDGTTFAVGYEPTVYDGRTDSYGWQGTSPEELERLLAA